MSKNEEAQLVALAIATIKEYCEKHECISCPLVKENNANIFVCNLQEKTPSNWNAYKLIYKMGYRDGRNNK